MCEKKIKTLLEIYSKNKEKIELSRALILLIPLVLAVAMGGALTVTWNAYQKIEYKEKIVKTEEKARLLITKSKIAIRNRKWEKALKYAQEAIKIMDLASKNKDKDFLELKSIAYLCKAEGGLGQNILENLTNVEEDFSKALKLTDEIAGGLVESMLLGRARTRIILEKYEKAEEDLELIIEKNPAFGVAYYWLAVIKNKQGNKKEELKNKEKTISLGLGKLFQNISENN